MVQTDNNLLEKVPYFQVLPGGYLSMKDYAKRVGTSKNAVLYSIRRGKIPPEYIVAFRKNGTGAKQFAIHWNRTINIFIQNRRSDAWPTDFNPDEIYKPLLDVDDEEEILDAEVASTKPDQDEKTKRINNIADAKLRLEKLKIAKLQAELRIANNEAVLMSDIVKHDQELATKLKGIITRAINSAAPLVAATSSVQTCRSILEAQFREAVETINPLNREDN